MISIVIPFFNEEEGLLHTLATISDTLRSLARPWEIVAVNDGSTDKTLAILLEQQRLMPELLVVDLSRNFGKEAALTAGLAHASGDAIIPMDADLQDPPELIAPMISKWEEGYEVVLARRSDRSSDSVAKRLSARWFYKAINKMSEVNVPDNVGDYRLMDRLVVDTVMSLPESRRFMKGIFAWVGFKTTTLNYKRAERNSGSSKFNLWKLWNLAIEGITSLSITPLRIWSYLGFMVASVSFIYALYIVVRTIVYGIDVPGYASLITLFLFFSGLQLIGLGIMGEYLGRAYVESKRRPPYIVRKLYLPRLKGEYINHPRAFDAASS
ncbi:glycosyltransferase family 2 protein [Iodobacter sp. HSC-16F04]|uniref:Glycosyltransferase family 2 protein n=1 Tax=Iodobacter violaceini TaxID=3044271 RepID=A0ABX0L194_9NEIS|nr:glycosyltransferase family 2 protein [Iodobacter violacea]NHQ88069.1 glycosyltransferase family 2 protein [Iodobacter violacea]